MQVDSAGGGLHGEAGNNENKIKVIILSGLPHGQEKSGNQEKSGKTKKNDKTQEKLGKMRVF